MTTCPLCPKHDNQVPGEMLPEHVALMHPETIMSPLRVTPIDGITQEQIGEVLAEVAPQIAASLLDRVATAEHQAEHAYMAGAKEAWQQALAIAAETLDRTAKEMEVLHPGDKHNPGIAHAAELIRAVHAEPEKHGTPAVLTAHELLTIINNNQTPNYCNYQLAVAVNLIPTYHSQDPNPTEIPVPGPTDPGNWHPFTPGEIVIVDADGREPFGQGRHTGKWYVEFETFQTLTEAQARAAQITSAT